MESTFFEFSASKLRADDEKNIQYYEMPCLGAYAIAYSSIDIAGAPVLVEFNDYNISDNRFVWYLEKSDSLEEECIRLIIYYYGIKDFATIFHFIQDEKLKNRLARHYEEAESCFANGNWLSYSLMCGSVFEGVIKYYLSQGGRGKKAKRMSFEDAINAAKSESPPLIDGKVSEIIHNTRNIRNYTHPFRHTSSYVGRRDAMGIRVAMDVVMKKFQLT